MLINQLNYTGGEDWKARGKGALIRDWPLKTPFTTKPNGACSLTKTTDMEMTTKPALQFSILQTLLPIIQPPDCVSACATSSVSGF